MGEVAFAVLRRQLAVVRAKEPGTRLGEDPEELHDMRVATRRLRAALSLFEGVLPVRAQAFREELGWLAGLLGAVRDLDVQLLGLADMSSGSADDHFGPGSAAATRSPNCKRCSSASVRRPAPPCSADSTRSAGTGWPRASPPWRSRDRRVAPLATRVPAVIGLPELVVARHDKVAKAAKRAKRSGVASDFHALRIRCKRLRYALEFSGDVYGGRTSRFVREVTRAAGRARCHAGRRGGIAPTAGPWPQVTPTCPRPRSS